MTPINDMRHKILAAFEAVGRECALEWVAVDDGECGGAAWMQRAGGFRTLIRLDYEFHHHLNAADWGIMVKYVLEDDDTVTPWVYDIATKRTGNNYHWSLGKPTAGNSPVQPPFKGH